MIENKKILILGGGQAGYLTALYCRKIFPKNSITLIEDVAKGIIGVGEATTPHFIDFLSSLNIDITDFIKYTGGSIKNGISFENWNGDNKKYFHIFASLNSYNDFKIKNIFGEDNYDYYIKALINENLNVVDYQYSSLLSYKNKIDLKNTKIALHLDTYKTSEYFNKISLERNIKIINDVFLSANSNEDGTIKSLNLKNNKIIECDFIFDCSGFTKAILGKHFNCNWLSYKKHLPVKKTLLFPEIKENFNDIFPYTKSIAMKYGWIFEIPLQHRIGRGYIFDSDFIDENEAHKEIEKFYNKKIDIKRTVDFQTGRFDKAWVKNCIGLGLSQNFIEPLESTSIWMTISQLQLLPYYTDDLFENNQLSQNSYNQVISNNLDSAMNFVYLHYLTKRQDSDFWINFKKNNSIPDNLQNIINLYENGNLRYTDLHYTNKLSYFSLFSWLSIFEGLEFNKNNKVNKFWKNNLIPTISEYKKMMDENVEKSTSHYHFLKSL